MANILSTNNQINKLEPTLQYKDKNKKKKKKEFNLFYRKHLVKKKTSLPSFRFIRAEFLLLPQLSILRSSNRDKSQEE